MQQNLAPGSYLSTRPLYAPGRGDFFVSTGEVLLPEIHISAGSKNSISVRARIKHTFPLQMAEVTWGDGSNTFHKTFPLANTHSFEDVPFLRRD